MLNKDIEAHNEGPLTGAPKNPNEIRVPANTPTPTPHHFETNDQQVKSVQRGDMMCESVALVSTLSYFLFMVLGMGVFTGGLNQGVLPRRVNWIRCKSIQTQ